MVTPDVIERFWRKVDKRGDDDCWEWLAGKVPRGYGRIWTGREGGIVQAHRVSWIIHNGPIPDGMYCFQTCRNPGCVNPRHLTVLAGCELQQIVSEKRIRRARAKKQAIERARLKRKEEAVEKVKRIREMYATGRYTLKKLGVMFGIAESAVSRIVNRKFYRWVD